MSRFLGVEIQSDVRCASGARLAHFAPRALAQANAVLSPTEPEAFVFAVARDAPGVEHIVEGRVARTTFTDTTMDREWDIITLSDGATNAELLVTCAPLSLRLARVIYIGANAADGSPDPRFTGSLLTASEWVDDLVIPAVDAMGMTWVNAGTYDSTVRFPLEGEWASALEIIRALCVPGRANGEWQLRRNGDTDYKVDILNSIGSTAAAFTVRTRVNLLANRRDRSLVDVATRLVPQLSGDEASWRTLAHHLFRIQTVVNGTTLALQAWDLSTGPVGFDDQLNGLYLAVLNSHTFATHLVTDSTQSTQRVVIASTSGMSAGQYVRFFVGSAVNGARVTSLAHPTRVLAPSAGGYGDRAMILPLGELVGASNYVPNPWMRAWTTPANPPDSWAEFATTPANVTFSQILTGTVYADLACFRVQVNTGMTGGACYVESPATRVWALADGRYVASAWVKIDAVGTAPDNKMRIQLMQGSTVRATIGEWVRGSSPDSLGEWVRYVSAPLDLSAITGTLTIRVSVTNGAATPGVFSGWDLRVGPVLLCDSLTGTAPNDIEGAPATAAWQAVNRRLAVTSSPTRGYDVAVADLARDDAATFAVYAFTPGGQGTLIDTDLGETVAQRLLEYRPDYLHPLQSSVRLGAPFDTLSAWQEEVLALTPRTPDPGVPDPPPPASLNISVATTDDEYLITWSGTGTVTVSIDGAAHAAPAASPITVTREAFAGGQSITYAFKSTGAAGDVQTQTVVVPKKEYVPPAEPYFSAYDVVVAIPASDTVEVSWTLANPPGGVDFDIYIDTDLGQSGSLLGDAASPGVVTVTGLTSGDGGTILIEAYDGATLVASISFYVSIFPE